jgi:hypothetical protein
LAFAAAKAEKECRRWRICREGEGIRQRIKNTDPCFIFDIKYGSVLYMRI